MAAQEPDSRCRIVALLAAAAWPALLAVASLAWPSSALADPADIGSPDLEAQRSMLPYAHLVLEAREMAIRFPGTQQAESQTSIRFVIVGNIPLKVHAEPDSRIQIGDRNLGRATSGSEAVGYDVAVRLDSKKTSKLGSMIEPKTAAGSYSSNSTTTGEAEFFPDEDGRTNWMWHKTFGELKVRTNASWSANGGLPLAGNYVGQVTITLTPDF